MKEDIFQEKVADILQDHPDFREIEAAREEFQDFVSKPVCLARPVAQVERLLFTFDNLGLDSLMCPRKRQCLLELTKRVKFNAERKELVALLDDVNQYLQWQREFSQEVITEIEQDEEVQIDEKFNTLDDQDDFKNTHFLEMYEREFVEWENQGTSKCSARAQCPSVLPACSRSVHRPRHSAAQTGGHAPVLRQGQLRQIPRNTAKYPVSTGPLEARYQRGGHQCARLAPLERSD